MIKLKTRDVSRSSYKNYLQKSEEFLRSATDSFENGQWNSSGVLAVHAVISAADALCAYYLGKRHAGERHDGVIDLLRSISVGREELDKNTARISRVINIKNIAEYEDRLLHEDDARRIMQDAQRFLNFVRIYLPAGQK